MNKKAKIFVAGHKGLVGSAILKNLQEKGYTDFVVRDSKELDLTDQQAVNTFFAEAQPEYVFLAAAYVGGIWANNTYRGDFIYRNLMIQSNVIHASYINNVKKLLFLGSTCIYPKEAPQPMPEECLLTSPLEYTNEPYAIAKIAGIKLCESYNIQYKTDFLPVMPTNLYGPNDNFDLLRSHVLPAMVRKIHLAKCLQEEDWNLIRKDMERRPLENGFELPDPGKIREALAEYGISGGKVTLWGTGKPKREFLWSEEMADASVYIMENVSFTDLVKGEDEIRNIHINIGTGLEYSIHDLAYLIKEAVGFNGDIAFDSSKPDGTMRKLTDVRKLHSLGWRHKINPEEGIRHLYRWYLNSLDSK